MFQRLTRGIAALAVGVALGTAGAANAQHRGGGHSGGHASGHAGGHMGGARAVAPVHSYSGHGHYGAGHANYGGHSYYHSNYGHTNYGHTNYGHSHYGHYPSYGYRYPGYGYGYRYPNYGYGYRYPYYGYGYGYPWGYAASLALGYALNRPYYDYGGYGYSYVPSYSYSDYSYAAPAYSGSVESYYPPAEPAPSPVINTAQITVQVPAGAKLWIDNQPSTQTGAVRTFETPATLEPGRTYSYKVTAEWVENGQPVVRERTVEFSAGNQLVVNLTVP